MAGLIGRITPSGTVTEFPGLTAGSAPRGIAAGPDGNLWFTEFNNPGRIGRITPAGAVTEFTTGLTANSFPRGIAAGPDGNVWFTELNDPGRIGRITPGPGAQTGAASDVGTTTATPAGTLRPNGQPATCRFRYEANTGFQHLGPPP